MSEEDVADNALLCPCCSPCFDWPGNFASSSLDSLCSRGEVADDDDDDDDDDDAKEEEEE